MVKYINCLRCNKEIEKRWNRKYCISCRKIVDDEIALVRRYNINKTWNYRKPQDFEHIDDVIKRRGK